MTILSNAGVTYHAIHPETFELMAFPRDVLHLPTSHTWFNLAAAIAGAICKRMDKDAQLTCFVSDNGSNYVKAAVKIMSDLNTAAIGDIGPDDWEQPADGVLPLHEQYGWRCVCHTAQLVRKSSSVFSAFDFSPPDFVSLTMSFFHLIFDCKMSCR